MIFFDFLTVFHLIGVKSLTKALKKSKLKGKERKKRSKSNTDRSVTRSLAKASNEELMEIKRVYAQTNKEMKELKAKTSKELKELKKQLRKQSEIQTNICEEVYQNGDEEVDVTMIGLCEHEELHSNEVCYEFDSSCEISH